MNCRAFLKDILIGLHEVALALTVLNNVSIKKITAGFIALISIGFLLTAHALEESPGSLSSLLDSSESENFLPPDVAFKVQLNAIDTTTVQAAFTIVPGHYLYRQRIKFEIPDENFKKTKIDLVILPNGEIKDDPNFGKQEVYHHNFTADIKLRPVQNGPIIIAATYQGCSEKGLCYAPIKKNISVTMPVTGLLADTAGSIEVSNEADKTTEVLRSGNLWLVIAGFFVAGLLLSFTPCVLPMIPILSSIIVGSQSRQSAGAKPSKLNAFGLSVAYVLGMALAYTLAGIAAGLSGNLLSQSLQSPWALGATAIIFVGLALSMFGVYELKLPSSFETRMLNASSKYKGGEFFSVFVMGILSALIVSPCVAAPLAGALIYIGQTHNVVLGGLGLFMLAIGMSVPLLLIGASAGRLLPKAGRWMTTVRNLFGVLMLVMAAYIVWPVLPATVTAPFENLLVSNTKHTLPFKQVKSVVELDAAIKAANGKSVMLDFYADWCTSCKEMEKVTFTDAKVKAALRDTVLLQADVTENNENDQALLKRFGLFGPPGIIFFDKNGVEIRNLRTIGFQNAQRFSITLLNR